MKKIYTKLIAITLALALSAVMLVMSSYAWYVISSSPELEGIQLTIGGGSTILVAADMTVEQDGELLHYPANFSSTLNFSVHESYRYLHGLSALTPVSTADGKNWFIPVYYDLGDAQVLDGEVLSGTLKPIGEYILDTSLSYANLTEEDAEKASYGNYICLDFWVVSPGDDYTLRISTGDNSSGSFVIGLQEAAVSETGGYTLVDSSTDASECVRVGFLVDTESVSEAAYAAYEKSSSHSSQYTSLRGSFADDAASRFTIYEPNADSHNVSGQAEDGAYSITTPIGLLGGRRVYTDIRDRLTVQLASSWALTALEETTIIEQQFQTAAAGQTVQSLEDLTNEFYLEYLDGQVSPYVSQGRFIKTTSSLYNAADGFGLAAQSLQTLTTAGATDDVYIVQLEQNVPQRIRLFIWLEGEDVDCVNSASSSAFAFSIELAGSNQE